ncbi:hypothetical protein [Ornithinimicrobium sp. CNJ-824]|nr:hypothetical protein [Ornithinimicrobium sp. CNJ-824]
MHLDVDVEGVGTVAALADEPDHQAGATVRLRLDGRGTAVLAE